MEFSLYVHVPFCTRTCPYCSFYQVRHQAGLESPFVETLLREAELLRDRLLTADARVATLYWGGGTPSLLSPSAIGELASGLARLFSFAPDLEFTVEANPGEITSRTMQVLRAAGANRLSLGCQSFQLERLRFLGRWHTAEQNRRAVAHARAAGFENLSLDLIFNLPPELGPEGWRADVAEVVEIVPEHLSVYGLTIEPGTVFATRAERGKLELLESEAYADEYLATCAALGRAGYEHYETSSFARPGYRSRHNSRYWTGGEYLGLGPAAHSFWRGRRWANVRSLERWRSSVMAGRPEVEPDDRFDPQSLYAEKLYLGLRSSGGLRLKELMGETCSLQAFTARLAERGLAHRETDVPVDSRRGSGVNEAAESHPPVWADPEQTVPFDGRLVLTDEGHLVLDEIVARLLVLGEARPAAIGPSPVVTLIDTPGA
jgi:oxygen-independent coproporphyrinogen-3 oxidase